LRFFRPERSDVAIDRPAEYFAMPMGGNARRVFLTTFGVTARLPAPPGRITRRALRGINSLVRKLIAITFPNLPDTDTKPDSGRACAPCGRGRNQQVTGPECPL
jgi:hypothetical protein